MYQYAGGPIAARDHMLASLRHYVDAISTIFSWAGLFLSHQYLVLRCLGIENVYELWIITVIASAILLLVIWRTNSKKLKLNPM